MEQLKRFDMVQRNEEGDWCVIDTENPDNPPRCGMSEDEARDMMGQMNMPDVRADAMEPVDRVRIRAIVTDDNWTLDVLSAPYGGPHNGRDAHGEFFSKNTNFFENEGAPLPLVVYYHGYTPDGKPQGEPEVIGRAVKTWRDNEGLWHKVILDQTKDYARRVWDAAKRGVARASTGVAGYMGRTNEQGEITHWLIGELSIWDAAGNRQPANQYAVARPAVKAHFLQAGFQLDEQDGSAIGDEQEQQSESSETIELPNDELPIERKDTPMADEITLSPADVRRIVAEQLAAERQEREAAEQAAQARQADIDAAVAAERAKWEAEDAPNRRLPSHDAPYIAEYGNLWKYDNLDVADLAFAASVLNATPVKASEDLRKALAIRATQEETAPRMKLAARELEMAMKRPLKANELNQSTLASYGDEWVGTQQGTELWDKIRSLANIVSRLPATEVPQGAESIDIPLNSTAPTFYKVAQASAQDTNNLGQITHTIPTSKKGTGKQTLTVGKLGAAVVWTSELDEDSLVNWAAELRRDVDAEAAEVLESLIIDGDTATTTVTNINDIAGTPGGTEYWLVLDGFRKLALVTNTANSRSAGTLTVEDYLETIKMMGLAGKNAMYKDKVSFIVDPWTYMKSLELTEIKTRDVSVAPTIENGQLTGLWGYGMIPTYNMHRANADETYGLKANSAGKLDLDTAANNLYGSILAVRWDQWRFGWKRRPKIEIMREPLADATYIVLTMRVGLINRDNEASAISYGITL
jgi:HK97 family phage major capsid protein